MNRNVRCFIALLSTTVVLAISAPAFAQGQDRGRAGDQATTQERGRTGDQPRIGDRDPDRIADRDRIQDRDPDRDADRLRDRDREQLHVQDRDELRGRDIYGSELMSRRERREYEARINEMENVTEWARYRAEHQERMTARAREQGVDLPVPFYGQQLMTDQERVRLRERLENAATEQERERIRNEHREQMQQRARDNAIPLSELE